MLADEQVILHSAKNDPEQMRGIGVCERCSSVVEKKNLEQWFFRITNYADRLLKNLEAIDWSEKIKIAQRNWIGRSEGAEITFKLNVPGQPDGKHEMKVFTTRPDTLFGATFAVVSPELAESWIHVGWKADEKVRAYVKNALARQETIHAPEAEQEKTGVFSGVRAINPANGEELPVWVSDYVLAGYGTGAIMAVPAHDQRDFEFAKKFGLQTRTVVEPVTGELRENEEFRKSIVAVVEDSKTGKFLSINWGPKLGGNLFVGGGIDGAENYEAAACREIQEETGYKNLKLVSVSEKIHHHYVAFSKNVNRNINATGLHFQLLNNEKTPPRLENTEKEKFSLEWLSKTEVLDKVKDQLHSLVFRRLILGEAYAGSGIMVNSGKFDGMDSEKAKKTITEFVGGEIKTQYRLRDWVVSRQRYWGAPIPIIYCLKDGALAAPEKDLPVLLPEIKDYKPRSDGKSPLAKAEKWLKVKCPKCGSVAERETDTLDTFVDSSWYFLRYCDPKNEKEFAQKRKMENWMPVDLYSGGAEHTTMHLLYSRFWYEAMFDSGLIPKELGDEPYKDRRNRGIILGPDGQKMSKSKGNVIDPDEYVAKFGADTVRMYLAFIGPYNEAGSYPWNPQGILGIRRFLDRVWKFASPRGKTLGVFRDSTPSVEERGDFARALNKTIKKVGEDIEEFHFNTAVSALMVLLNEMEKVGASSENFSVFLKLLAPFAPHLAEELWSRLGNKASIHFEPWPKYDPKLVEENTFELIIQINGKVRDKFEVPVNISQSEAERLTLAREKVKLALENRKPRKIIFVPRRLVNIVV